MSKDKQIKLWDDELRTLPQAFARSALFRAANRSARSQISGEIAAGEGLRIHFYGQELRTDDEELLMLLLHNLRFKDLRDAENLFIDITRYELLRALERPVDGRYYKEVAASLDRMALGGLKLHYRSPTGRRFKITQSLIRKVAYSDEGAKTGKSDNDNGRYRIWLEPEVLQFFLGDDVGIDTFSIEWRERVSLRRPMAKWLHSYLHALGFGQRQYVVCSLDQIWKLSGSEAATLKNFRVSLQRALQDMKDAEVIGEWSIRSEMLAVVRHGEKAEIDWTSNEAGMVPMLGLVADSTETGFGDLEDGAAPNAPAHAHEPIMSP